MDSSTPLSHWIGFHVYIIALLAIELLYARRGAVPTDPAAVQSKTHRTAVAATILWIAAALAFAFFVLRTLGSPSSVEYLAGYAIEESLSIDNLFVFLLLFQLFRIEPARQPRVLFWGVAGAIVMRGAFIAAGLGLLARFEWISYIFALILLGAAIRLLIPEKEKEEHGSPRWLKWLSKIHPVSLRQDCFFVRENGRRMGTMLLLCLVAIEITDIVFALDSIPAVLSITRHPFLAYTSNIMAVMGLRSLYFLLAHLLIKLRFLHYGLAVVLAFAALKMLSAHWIEIGPLPSLGVIITTLAITIILSLLLPPKPTPEPTSV
ncbi:TerC/Alx family metal homeostasis membrane protein [Granulicella sp. dw_53]|uniref:TerC/Alx family metal homeostasis membrane protein n=1 Tax=Granulicella sp. dw_53 TaxID=2719792 RepID=UPI001BD29A9D|nr:TerC/Alx family metal homeostasis membrane protein [Granulicella sp. dw_53]